jgi:prepilin-type N-terminal cleavage/methylation domain-containing protein
MTPMKAVANGKRRGARGPNRPRRPSRAFALPHRSPRATRHSFGYTLLELLLVVAILVIFASAVAPTVVARMSEYRLKQAAETARFALTATRIHAIDVSSIYQFRFEPGGRRYLAVPTDGDVMTTTSPQTRSTAEYGQLPENLSFQVVTQPFPGGSSPTTPGMTPGVTTGMPASSTDSAWSAAVARVRNAGDFRSVIWSPPILFRPDGTAMDAALNVVDQHGDGFQLKVRELTGEVFVTRLTTGTL